VNYQGQQDQQDRQERNELLAIREYYEGKTIVESYPPALYLELTANCDLDCVMCPVKSKYDPRLDMSQGTFLPYVKYVELRGYGETLVLNNVISYLEYTEPFSCQFSILTNLNTIDQEVLAYLMRRRFLLGISFDGATRETFERIRRGSAFSRILDNLRYVVSLREQLGRSKTTPTLHVTVQQANLGEISDIVRLARDLDIRSVRLSPIFLNKYTGADGSFSSFVISMQRAAWEAASLAANLGIKLELRGMLSAEKNSSDCASPWMIAYITYSGNVQPCLTMQTVTPGRSWTENSYLAYGNVNQEKFSMIWNNEKFQSLRKGLSNKNVTSECGRCIGLGRNASIAAKGCGIPSSLSMIASRERE
jgi:MoaA/NifB/PqqE/SkfB family radical SAM enzyme